jgi:hypothetical protein
MTILGECPMKKIYLSGVYVNESHIEAAWARIRAGVKLELAVASVLPASKRINSTRTAYQNSLISVLTFKRQLFTLAYEESKKSGDWRRVFRGRRRIFWPSIQERTELGLSDYTRHELILIEPYRGRPLKVTMTIDHEKRSVREAVVLALNGRAKKTGNGH